MNFWERFIINDPWKIDLNDGSYRSMCLSQLIEAKRILDLEVFSKRLYLLLPKEQALKFCEAEGTLLKSIANLLTRYKRNFGVNLESYLDDIDPESLKLVTYQRE